MDCNPWSNPIFLRLSPQRGWGTDFLSVVMNSSTFCACESCWCQGMVCTQSLCGRFSLPVVLLCSTPGNGQCHLLSCHEGYVWAWCTIGQLALWGCIRDDPLVRSDDGIIRVKMKPERLSGVSEEGDGSFSCVCRRLSLRFEFPLSVFFLPSYECAPSGESLLLCDNGQLHIHIPLLNFFEKNSSYVSGLSVWIFLALWLCVFGCQCQGPIRLKVLWVDARNQRDFGTYTWHCSVKVKQEHFETATLILHNFVVF